MSEWIAIGLVVLGMVVGFAVTWGRMDGRMDGIDKALALHSEYHRNHYEHAKDDDAHWTRRERLDLAKKLDEIHAEQRETSKEVRELARRMYGDAK